jgi:hypothetical protein
MRRIIVVVSALIMGTACDPGWSYHVPDASVGTPRAPDARGAISMQTRAELFTGSLDVEIELTNRGGGALVVHEARFRVLDSSHRPLPWYWGHPPDKPCEAREQAVVTLDRGQSCTMRGRFLVRPNAGVFGGRNMNLKTLTVVVDGLVRGSAPVEGSEVLEWD